MLGIRLIGTLELLEREREKEKIKNKNRTKKIKNKITLLTF